VIEKENQPRQGCVITQPSTAPFDEPNTPYRSPASFFYVVIFLSSFILLQSPALPRIMAGLFVMGGTCTQLLAGMVSLSGHPHGPAVFTRRLFND
jgi:hypothetical protein